MSKEITFSATLSIRKLDADTTVNPYPLISKSYQKAFTDDMSLAHGPSPGLVEAAIKGSGGTQVSLSSLTRPGWCWFRHEGRADGTGSQAGDHVTIGVYDTDTRKFYPLAELRPGWEFPMPLSRDILDSYVGPGTGTSGQAGESRLMLLAYPVAQKVSVEAYEF